jgi:hypothetical protein
MMKRTPVPDQRRGRQCTGVNRGKKLLE